MWDLMTYYIAYTLYNGIDAFMVVAYLLLYKSICYVF